MALQFKPAVKTQLKCRLAIAGPSGSGKSYTALKVASKLSDKIAVIDTENDSATRYADEFKFDHLNLRNPSIKDYLDAMTAAVTGGFGCLVVDQASAAWDWAKQEVDRVTAQTRAVNSFASWAKVTPEWQKFIDMILHSKIHIITCFRSKTEYVLEDVQRGDRTVKMPRKIGLAPITRDNTEYEFDVWCDVDMDHRLIVGKNRCRALDGKVFDKDSTDQFTETLKAWLESGAAEVQAGDGGPSTPASAAPPVHPEVGERELADQNNMPPPEPHDSQTVAANASADTWVPSCPLCKAPMRKQKRRDGSGEFWSCSTWKDTKCKGSMNLDQAEAERPGGAPSQLPQHFEELRDTLYKMGVPKGNVAHANVDYAFDGHGLQECAKNEDVANRVIESLIAYNATGDSSDEIYFKALQKAGLEVPAELAARMTDHMPI